MTMIEEVYCPNCKERGPHTHACQEPVLVQTMSLEEIQKLEFYCEHCGRVADAENKLCQPLPLKAAGKELFIKATRGTGEAHVCQVCGQPVLPPGHICDPKGLPMKCEFCGTLMKTPNHICSGILENAKYYCRDCGRVAEKKEYLCSPKRLQ